MRLFHNLLTVLVIWYDNTLPRPYGEYQELFYTALHGTDTDTVNSRDDGALVLLRYDTILCILYCGVEATWQHVLFCPFLYKVLLRSAKV